jgi:uncharacterized protein (TIGR03435 family)
MRGRLHTRCRSVVMPVPLARVVLVLFLAANSSGVLVAQVAGSQTPAPGPQPAAAKWQPAPVPAWQTAAGGHLEFDVVSVHQNKSGPPWTGGQNMTMNVPYGPDDNFVVTGGVLSAKNYPLLNLLVFAYKVPTAQGEALLASLPLWTNSDLFDIEARTDNHDVTKDQMRLMMQSLLADRFHLIIHRELREVQLYAAVLIKPGMPGPNIRPHPADQTCSSIYISPKNGGPPVPAPDAHAFANNFPLRCRTFGPGPAPEPYFKTEGARDLPMDAIVGTFSGLGNLGRPVIDQTGLTGTYDWFLAFLPELPPGAQMPGRPPDAGGPSFLEAIRNQLGIKLVSQKGPYDYLIVDHIEHPSEN